MIARAQQEAEALSADLVAKARAEAEAILERAKRADRAREEPGHAQELRAPGGRPRGRGGGQDREVVADPRSPAQAGGRVRSPPCPRPRERRGRPCPRSRRSSRGCPSGSRRATSRRRGPSTSRWATTRSGRWRSTGQVRRSRRASPTRTPTASSRPPRRCSSTCGTASTRPRAKDFLTGTIKSNNPMLLKEFVEAVQEVAYGARFMVIGSRQRQRRRPCPRGRAPRASRRACRRRGRSPSGRPPRA